MSQRSEHPPALPAHHGPLARGVQSRTTTGRSGEVNTMGMCSTMPPISQAGGMKIPNIGTGRAIVGLTVGAFLPLVWRLAKRPRLSDSAWTLRNPLAFLRKVSVESWLPSRFTKRSMPHGAQCCSLQPEQVPTAARVWHQPASIVSIRLLVEA